VVVGVVFDGFGFAGRAERDRLLVGAEVDILLCEPRQVGGDDKLLAGVGHVDRDLGHQRINAGIERPAQLAELPVHPFDQLIELLEGLRFLGHTHRLTVNKVESFRCFDSNK